MIRPIFAALVAAGALPVVAPAAGAQQPEPYRDPPFTCEVIDYGTEAPTPPTPPDDPLCVRYDKTNITISTLEAVDFLAAEPGRVVLVLGKCSYWQQDHWIVRAAPDATPIVEWEGSYWYDGRTGTAAGILRGLRVGGEPADGEAFAEALRPLIGDDAADEMRSYAAEGGGGGATFSLPLGFGSDACSAAGPSDPSDPSDPSKLAGAADAAGAARGATDGAANSRLPRSGDLPPAGVAGALVLVALAANVGLRRVSVTRIAPQWSHPRHRRRNGGGRTR